MVLFQLTTMRFITIYIAQGFIFAFFLFLAIKILKRDRKRLNVIFAGFYISPVIGFFVNFIYGPMTDVNLVLLLNFVTNFGIFYSAVFLVVFDLILLKSEKVITTAKQTLIFLAYGIAMFGMVFFLFIPGAGVTLNASWSPVWALPFFIYVVLVVSIGAVIPFLYLSIQIYKKFEDDLLKKKWKFFIYGFCCLIVFMYGIFISNTLNIDNFRTVLGLLGLILAVAGGYLMYNGVGRQLEK